MRALTLDDVAHYPQPGLAIPGKFSFSPSGKLLTFLHDPDGGMARKLWAYDIASGERSEYFAPEVGVTDQNVSREEALRRERQRLMHSGVTHYEWADEKDVMLIPLRGELWIAENGRARRIGENGIDPRLSPSGDRVAFVRDSELWCLDVATGAERQLTHDAQPGVTNGLAEFVAQEEMGRAHGFWWSADGEWLAFEQADERHIPVFRIPHWGTDATHDVEEHRYPFAGQENVRVKLGVVAATGGEVTWCDLGDAEYLCRVAWHPDGRLFVQTTNRDQTRLELRACDRSTGRASTLLDESSDIWVNLHDDLAFVPPTGEFVWASERTGTKQLYLYSADATEHRPLTSFDFPVGGVTLDVTGRRFAFSAATTPIENHVFIGSLDGGEIRQLTREPGMHGAVFAHDLSAWIDLFHSRTHPPSLVLHGPSDVTIHASAEIDVALVTPELFTFSNRDGITLHGKLYRPARLPAPLIVSVYGGPHANMVGESWADTVSLRAQYLTAQGFAVMSVDNRGSARRGIAFEGALLKRMGTVEVDDQVDGVRYAQEQGWVDGDRVGMYGWSYGGYMTLMCMLKAADVFKVGVAGAPVTSWDGYDTFYTERYMRTPQGNEDGYRDGSPLTYADRLRGKLMIIHGMIDENVHFRNTARFLDALAKANRPVDLLLYPEERHSPRSELDRRNMEERIVEYFRAHL